jgi:hypothetical protein
MDRSDYLGNERPIELDTDPLQHPTRKVISQVDALRTLRIDGWRDDVHSLDRQTGWDEVGHGEDGGVVTLQVRLQEFPRAVVRLRGVDVATPDPARRHCRETVPL